MVAKSLISVIDAGISDDIIHGPVFSIVLTGASNHANHAKINAT